MEWISNVLWINDDQDAFDFPEDFEDDECNCDYGFGLCVDPETRDLGLCTTECSLYLDSLEETIKKNGQP